MKGDKRNDRLRKKNTPRYILPVPFDLRGVLLILDFPRSHKARFRLYLLVLSLSYSYSIQESKCNKISSLPSLRKCALFDKIRSKRDPSDEINSARDPTRRASRRSKGIRVPILTLHKNCFQD